MTDRLQTNKHPFIKGIGRGGRPFEVGGDGTYIDPHTKLLALKGQPDLFDFKGVI